MTKLNVAVAVLALVAAALVQTVAAAPTDQELRDAILTLDDVGSGFRISDEGLIHGPGRGSYHRSFITRQGPPVQSVAIQLTDAHRSLLTLDSSVGAATTAFRQRGFAIVRATPPTFLGEQAQAYTVSGRLSGESVTGEIVGWEEYGVRAVIAAFGSGDPRALNFVQRQHERLGAAFGPAPPAPPPATQAPSTTMAPPLAQPSDADEFAVVTRAIDGDTIEVEFEDGRTATVRYIGVDTPESVAPGRPVDCYALEASQRNRELVEGRLVRLERDVSDTDRFNRLLRYVYLEDVTFVNEALVAEGYARAATFPPDVRYADRFLEAERTAREQGLGLWGACPAVMPTPPTSAPPVEPPAGSGRAQPQGRDCPASHPIKGNRSSSGELIYHVPGGQFYGVTIPEECFATEADAQAAGYRRSQR